MRRVLFSLIIVLIVFPQLSYGQDPTFTKQEIESDILYLKKKLIKYHPNLFTYSSPVDFAKFFAEIEESLPNKTPSHEAYKIISKTSTLLKDGHTVFLPRIEDPKAAYTQKKVCPFKIHWDGETLFILQKFIHNPRIQEGDKILSINGIKAERVVSEMLESIMRDGNNQTYPLWVLNTYFQDYFGFFYGYPTEFKLQMLSESGDQYEVQLEALSKSKIASSQFFGYPAVRPVEKAIFTQLIDTSNTAILTIKSWDNVLLKKKYKQDFSSEIESAFQQIFDAGIENLVLDLRDNQGGDIKNGKILLSYLLNHPFELVEGFKKMNKKQELISCKGPQTGTHQPYKKTFKGKLFVLINGGSFSNTGIVSAALRKYKRATLLGEETGGSAYLLAGNIKNITLPHTQIKVQIPRLRFTIETHIPTKSGGVQPDYLIEPKIVDLVQQEDKVLRFALDLIDN